LGTSIAVTVTFSVMTPPMAATSVSAFAASSLMSVVWPRTVALPLMLIAQP